MHFMPLIISGTRVVSIMKMTIPIIQQMDIGKDAVMITVMQSRYEVTTKST